MKEKGNWERKSKWHWTEWKKREQEPWAKSHPIGEKPEGPGAAEGDGTAELGSLLGPDLLCELSCRHNLSGQLPKLSSPG